MDSSCNWYATGINAFEGNFSVLRGQSSQCQALTQFDLLNSNQCWDHANDSDYNKQYMLQLSISVMITVVKQYNIKRGAEAFSLDLTGRI